MRNLLIALLFLFAAMVLAACTPTAIQKASDTLDKITITTRDVQASYRKLVVQRLDAIATEERDLRTAALLAAGCNPDPAGVQPSDACRAIVAEAKARYEARKEKVVGIATKLDAATGLVYAALLTAVDVLILVRDGAKDQWPKLSALVAEAVKVGEALANAWADFKRNAASY
jgi:hypothetical protein